MSNHIAIKTALHIGLSVAGAATIMGFARPARAAVGNLVTGEPIQIVNGLSASCMSVGNWGQISDGVPIVEYQCLGQSSAPDQWWIVNISDSSVMVDGFPAYHATIQNYKDQSYCLAASGDESQAFLMPCNVDTTVNPGAAAPLGWLIRAGKDQNVEIAHAFTGFGSQTQLAEVLALDGNQTADLTPIITWADETVGGAPLTHTEQQWYSKQ
ncbi:MAG: hypothetical protein FWD17_17155 [Polyangiaceae bacterium]|nr:hypothetical protein [Polyangiaceae bacterium]